MIRDRSPQRRKASTQAQMSLHEGPTPLGAALRSELRPGLLVPLLVSFLVSIVLFSVVLLLAALFIVGGLGMWAFAPREESRFQAAAILIYGLTLSVAPAIVMVIALYTTRNQ